VLTRAPPFEYDVLISVLPRGIIAAAVASVARLLLRLRLCLLLLLLLLSH
jgi:hypothetical protein